jgi:hypothetical protein
MGLTRNSGPVYGAKGLLWVTGPAAAASTSASTVNAFLQPAYGKRVVPPYEDWFVTEAYLTCSTVSTVVAAAQWILKTEGGSTTVPRSNGNASTNAATILTIASGGSSNMGVHAIAAVTAGEIEGTWCPAGSTLRWVSSYADATTLPQMQVMGYIRYIDSTRAVS